MLHPENAAFKDTLHTNSRPGPTTSAPFVAAEPGQDLAASEDGCATLFFFFFGVPLFFDVIKLFISQVAAHSCSRCHAAECKISFEVVYF